MPHTKYGPALKRAGYSTGEIQKIYKKGSLPQRKRPMLSDTGITFADFRKELPRATLKTAKAIGTVAGGALPPSVGGRRTPEQIESLRQYGRELKGGVQTIKESLRNRRIEAEKRIREETLKRIGPKEAEIRRRNLQRIEEAKNKYLR